MAASKEPFELNPQERGEHALLLIESGAFKHAQYYSILPEIKTLLHGVQYGTIHLTPEQLWHVARGATEEALRSFLEEQQIGIQFGVGKRSRLNEEILERTFGFPFGINLNLNTVRPGPKDIDKLTAALILANAPNLGSAIPESVMRRETTIHEVQHETPHEPEQHPPTLIALPPPTREYVEERIHRGPEGVVHTEFVRGVESVPTPTPTPTPPPKVTVTAEMQNAASLLQQARPEFLDDLVNDGYSVLARKIAEETKVAPVADLLQNMRTWTRTGRFPECVVLSGPPGLGKTTAARAMARSYYRAVGEKAGEPDWWRSDNPLQNHGMDPFLYLEFGPEEYRGDIILLIQSRVRDFLRAMPPSPGGQRVKRILVFDEISGIPKDTQVILNRLIESYTRNALIVFTTNYREKIIPAILSRCEEGDFIFKEPTEQQTSELLLRLAPKFGMNFPDLQEEALAAARRSMSIRSAISLFSSAWTRYVANLGL